MPGWFAIFLNIMETVVAPAYVHRIPDRDAKMQRADPKSPMLISDETKGLTNSVKLNEKTWDRYETFPEMSRELRLMRTGPPWKVVARRFGNPGSRVIVKLMKGSGRGDEEYVTKPDQVPLINFGMVSREVTSRERAMSSI
jgi:hypothetical protein